MNSSIRRTAIAPAITELEQSTRVYPYHSTSRKRNTYHFCGRPRKPRVFTPAEIQAYRLHQLWTRLEKETQL